MRRLWISLVSSLIAVCGATTTYAAKPADNGRIAALDNLSNEELIMSVPLGKQAELVSAFQGKEAIRLLRGDYKASTGCNVETYRDREVIIITIPAANLFAPNDTELTEGAAPYLLR